ncbi:hypothetical protein F5884DRAFT_810294 [Xylogone sp. PMI_703]|nr:hypothetical protein F5884DRAFT_810294 [Xylogone sp. PMI_703]
MVGKEPPLWYCRLDLSELDESDSKSEGDQCDCEGSECECEDYSTDDSSSEKSYTGSDSGYYYELKAQREERKRELRKEKEADRVFESEKEQEVQKAYERLRNAELKDNITSPDSIGIDKHWKLYSVDYVEHCHDIYDFQSTKYVNHPLMILILSLLV